MIGRESYTQQDSCEGQHWTPSHPVQDREARTWLQFRERFRSHNVPAGLMKMKQKEFLALK